MAEKQNQNDPWGAISSAVADVGVAWAIAWTCVKIAQLLAALK